MKAYEPHMTWLPRGERPIPALTSDQLEILTQLHVRQIRRVQDREAVLNEVHEILSYFQAHANSTPILCRSDGGVPILRLLEERTAQLLAHMARLQDEERQDRAIERALWRPDGMIQ
ncbi:uncharacterized protein N7487_010330 [Penicillium crustosum]|uniref:uncharacterized protein n=1 Tax=Penicillium crustosum TaxID=36656 RepID=UPI0023A2909E|nr:uncharacterized protein N7487_010330 [Penicillium crustosum]KAJ5396027.1 hypothetical protein N7487_010330 [Penicillium crustosum]